MKKISKVLLSVLGVIYLGVIIFATVCLLFYNQYKVTQINDKTFILIDSKSDKYTDGDLVIFTKNPNNEINSGDEIFFYEVSQGKVSVNTGVVSDSEVVNESETTFTINGNHKISSESVIGKTLTANVYPKVGKILYVIESRFGFLLFVILPALLFFFYEIYRLVMEIKTPVEDDVDEPQLKEVVVSKIADTTLNNEVNLDNSALDVTAPILDTSINNNLSMDTNTEITLENKSNSVEEAESNEEVSSMNLTSNNLFNEKPVVDNSSLEKSLNDDSSDDVESLL